MRKILTIAALGVALVAAFQFSNVTMAAKVVSRYAHAYSSVAAVTTSDVAGGYQYVGFDPDPRVMFELNRDRSWARANGN